MSPSRRVLLLPRIPAGAMRRGATPGQPHCVPNPPRAVGPWEEEIRPSFPSRPAPLPITSTLVFPVPAGRREERRQGRGKAQKYWGMQGVGGTTGRGEGFRLSRKAWSCDPPGQAGLVPCPHPGSILIFGAGKRGKGKTYTWKTPVPKAGTSRNRRMPGGTRTPPGIAGWQGLGCLLHLSGCCLSFPRKKDGGKDALSQLRNPPLWMVGRGHGAIKRLGGGEVGEREGVQVVQGDSPGVGMDSGSAWGGSSWQQGWGPPQIRSSHPLSC